MVAAPTEPASFAPGAMVGRYEIVRRLGAGGMAEVFLARVRGVAGWEKQVAIKRIHAHLADDGELVDAFLAEARLAARLDHPNVATVLDVGRHGDTYYFAMEYVRGRDLHAILRRLRVRKERLPLAQAATIVLGVAAGLHHAHDACDDDGRPLGIVHRDVSPSNVLLGDDGAIKVVDFGIAKAADRQGTTRTGTLKGKIPYMSPEQCQALPLDRRSDVFALGVLLYELTTGARPFSGDSELALLQTITMCEPVPPSGRVDGYPRALEAVVLRAMQRDPARRYQTAGELHLALDAVARGQGWTTSAVALGAWLRRIDDREEDESVDERPRTEVLAPAAAAPDATVVEAPTVVERPRRRRPMARGIAAAAVAIATIGTIAAVAARRVRVEAELVRTQDVVMERVATPAPMTHAMTSPAPPATAQPAASMRTKTVEERARPARTRRGARPAKATTKPAAATAKAPAATEPAKSTWDPDSMYLPGQR